MIVDSLENMALYESVHADFKAVFDVIRQMAAGNITEKVVLRDGDVWVNAPKKTDAVSTGRLFEAHKNFIDLHFILQGAETFGYANINRLHTVIDYDPSADLAFWDGERDFITLQTGDVCITFPQDAHIPSYENASESELIRIVAKVRC